LFTYANGNRPPDDAYGIHCYWEMQAAQKLISEVRVGEGSTEYDGLKSQWSGPPATKMRITKVAELSPELGYPRRLVALAEAEIDGAEGLIVLDGPQSRWYPNHELPDAADNIVLMLHVGRELLGFREQPQRTRFLGPPPAP